MNRILLVSANQIKEMSTLEMNVDEKSLNTLIWDAQQLKIKETLGDALFGELYQEAINRASDPQYIMDHSIKSLLNDYVIPYLIYSVLQDWMITSNYKMTNKGMLKLNDANATNLTPSELEYAKDQYDQKAMAYKSKLVEYLKANGLLERGADTDTTTESTGWFFFDQSDDFVVFPGDGIKLNNDVTYIPYLEKGVRNGVATLDEDGLVPIEQLPEILGNDKFHKHEQIVVSNSWLINHNLNKKPSVTVTDTADTEISGSVTYLNDITLKINFNAPVKGFAYLN